MNTKFIRINLFLEQAKQEKNATVEMNPIENEEYAPIIPIQPAVQSSR